MIKPYLFSSSVLNEVKHEPHIQITKKLMEATNINSYEILLVSYVYTVNLHGDAFYRTNAQISSALNMSSSSVARCLHDLVNKHYIYVAQSGNRRYLMINVHKVMGSGPKYEIRKGRSNND